MAFESAQPTSCDHDDDARLIVTIVNNGYLSPKADVINLCRALIGGQTSSIEDL